MSRSVLMSRSSVQNVEGVPALLFHGKTAGGLTERCKNTMRKSAYPRAEAIEVAEAVRDSLEPVCQRIQIVGSLRRGKPAVGDIELLYVPKWAEQRDGLFDVKKFDLSEALLHRLLSSGIIEKRPNVNGHFAWGSKNKLGLHAQSGIPVDFFSCEPQNWFVSLVVRTGSKFTNITLANGAIKKGGYLLAYGSGIQWSDGSVEAATSERHLFDLCGVPYLEPEQR